MATKRLTWLEASKLPSGTRVRFVAPHDIFPHLLVEVGAEGVVTVNDLNAEFACLYVLPDDERLRDALRTWGGEIMLRPDDESESFNPDWKSHTPLVLSTS